MIAMIAITLCSIFMGEVTKMNDSFLNRIMLNAAINLSDNEHFL